jgi:DNA-binding transcriptional LysR family regulator
MNWDDLKIFLVVSRAGRLDRAAAFLRKDSTTISRRLTRLEQDLGLSLFERTPRGYTLTSAGERLAARAEKMESAAHDIEGESTPDFSMAGRIRIGVTEGLGSAIIAPALAEFRRLHPVIDIDLIALPGFVSVPKREADMSILLSRPKAGPIKIRKLVDYGLRLYGSAAYLAEHAPVLSRDGLAGHTLVGYVDDLIYSAQLRYIAEVLPGRVVNLGSSSIVAQAEMIAAGAGLGILPEFMATRIPGLICVLPDQIRIERSFWLAVHRDVSDLKRIRLMSDFLVRVIV